MDAMKLSYVTTGHEGIASFRYRIQAPGSELLKNSIFPEVSPKADRKAPVVVFSKHWTYNDASYAKFCKLRGQKVIFDVCDDHLETKYREHYLRMIELANVVTVNSKEMRKRVLTITGKDAVVIPDPVLSPKGEYSPNKAGAMIWYGQSMNIQGLYDVYKPGCNLPLIVAIPGQVDPPEHFRTEYVQWVQWHKDVIPALAKDAVLSLLPYRQKKPAKSANRVLESLWCGIPVLTDSIPAVDELKHGIRILTGNLEQDADGILKHDLTEEMQMAQQDIQEKYSPEAVGNEWVQVIRSLA